MIEYTDQQFLYRQTPVNYDGIAKFTSIKGNTLGWNQLIQNGNFADTSNWTKGSGASSLAISNNEAVITIGGAWNNDVRQNQGASFISGHKYFASFEAKASVPISLGLATINVTPEINFAILTNVQTTFKKIASIVTAQSNADSFRIVLVENGSSYVGETFTVRNVQIIDLTAMGLDITDPSEFTSLFPLLFYDFNQGTLIPFSGNGIKTTGKNLLNPSSTTINAYINDSGVITASSKDKSVIIPLLSNMSYVFTWNRRTSISPPTYEDTQVGLYNEYPSIGMQGVLAGNTSVSGNNIRFNSGSNKYAVIKIANITRTDFDSTIIASQLEIGSTSTSYEPYTSSTLSLPISTYFPTGMKSAGTAYDELTPSKAITRIGVADLGTFTWTMYSVAQGNLFRSPNLEAIGYSLQYDSTNQLCAKYPTVKSSLRMDKSISVGYNHCVDIIDSSFSDATAFKNAMSGVYLYYELATETETDIDTEIFYPFYGGGTEQILPVNGSTPTTAPIFADIVYYTKIDSNTPYRKFWLVNGNGDRWNLTEKEVKSFLDSPQGLGFQKSIDVTRYGERAYKNTETYNFPQVSGDVFFYDTANATRYEKYNEFVRFLMVQPLTLYYQIPVSIYSGIADIYTLDCEVINLTKTESKTNRVLTSNIQINGLGFYQGDTVEINGTSATVTINNDGDFPVGFEIEINGDFKNPYITLEQDGELYGEAKFVDEGTNFSSVYVDSKDSEQNVVLKQNGSILPNPLAYQDLSISNGSVYVTFVKLAKGESTLKIGADSYSISNYSIKFTPMYRSI